MMTVFLPLNGSLFSPPALVYPLRLSLDLLNSVNAKLFPMIPRTPIMDFTMTHVRFGRSHLHPMGQLTHTRRSDGAPDPYGSHGTL